MSVPRTIYMRTVCRFRSRGKIIRRVDLSPPSEPDRAQLFGELRLRSPPRSLLLRPPHLGSVSLARPRDPHHSSRADGPRTALPSHSVDSVRGVRVACSSGPRRL